MKEYESLGGREVARIKVEANDAGDGFVVHSKLEASGAELVAGVGVALADWISGVARGKAIDPTIELGMMMAAIQSQAFAVLAERRERG